MVYGDWLRLGLKLIGVYFAATGFVGLWGAAVLVLLSGSTAPAGVAALGLLRPIAEFVVAFVLILKTDVCLRWCGLNSHPAPPAG